MTINWSTATGGEICSAMREVLQSLQKSRYTPLTYSFLNPVMQWGKIKKGPRKGRVFVKKFTSVQQVTR